MKKRTLAVLLSACMLLTAVPYPAFAADTAAASTEEAAAEEEPSSEGEAGTTDSETAAEEKTEGKTESEEQTESKEQTEDAATANTRQAADTPFEDEEEKDGSTANYEYTSKDSKVTITKYKGSESSVTIPEQIDGMDVVDIGNSAFENHKEIGSVTFPESVTGIGTKVFSGCTGLTEINFSEGLETIGTQAFAGCTSLTAVHLPDSVVTIDAGAFAKCSNLSDVTLSESLTTMNAHAFFDDDKITDIDIPAKLTKSDTAYIYEYAYDYQSGAFYGCDGLKNITFEKGTTKVAGNLFANCPGIEEIRFNDTIVSIGQYAFGNCDSLRKIDFPSSLTSIGYQSFAGCEQLTEIDIPDSVTMIDAGAFGACTNLAKVKLPENLTTLNAHAFFNDDLITDIRIPKNLTKTNSAYIYAYAYDYQNGPFYGCDGLKNITFAEGIKVIAGGLFANCPGIEEIQIPDTVTEIDNLAFINCKNLAKIKFSEGLTRIGTQSFANCPSIEKLDLPDGLALIDAGAFAKCSALTTVKLPEYLTTLNAHVFFNDDKLSAIKIPKRLVKGNTAYIYEYAYDYQWGPFYGCDGLKEVTFEEGTTEITQGLFAHCPGIEDITIPDTVRTLEANCFLDATGLTKIDLGSGVETIDQSAFNGCTSLKSVSLPDSVTSMGTDVFNGCSSLEEAKLPAKRVNVMERTFKNCTSLKSITLPDTVENVREEAFYNCKALETVNWDDKLSVIGEYAFEKCDSLKKIELPEHVTKLWRGAFFDCDGLTDVVIPDSVTTFDRQGFSNCEVLKSVTLGSGLTQIPAKAFSDCPALEEIVIPRNVVSIGEQAFANDTALVSVTIPRSVTEINTSAFNYPNKTVIYGVSGTYAETFAKENGYTFVSKEVNASDVSLSDSSISLRKGESTRLKLTVEPSDFTDAVTWKSSNTDIVTVDTNGTVQGVSAGKATIKVNVGEKTASCAVTVTQPVTDMDLNTSEVKLEALDTYQFTVTAYPSDADNKSVAWSSSNPEIADVDENGLVTAKKKGTATITALASDGSGVRVQASVQVTNNAMVCKSADEMESPHNYENNSSDVWVYTLKGAKNLSVTFDNRTDTEDGFDYIYIYDGDKNETGKYTGTELAGKTITMSGNTVRIKLVSDGAGTEWGFKVTDISASGEDTPVTPDPEPTPVKEFSDVTDPANSFYDSVYWAAENGITTGYSNGTFGVSKNCSRGAFVTFLWRQQGSPEPTLTAEESGLRDFSSIGKSYQKAVLWAVENGITTGYKDKTFRVSANVTRGAAVTFLWRAAGKPKVSITRKDVSFTDMVPAGSSYETGILWAVSNKITTGYRNNTFRPANNCTRGATVTFLQRFSDLQ